MKVRKITGVLFVLGLFFLVGCNQAASQEKPDTIRLDYAHYSPTSLVLKESGLVEEAFEEEGIEVEWVFSQGSNQALEYLNSNSVDFGSTAGAAALISKSNGSPIENVYIYSRPEWTALVTNEGSGIEELEDLEGKTVAATIGTDPYIFLLRALATEGIDEDDIELVNLQHGDGANSLLNDQVDAWAGLDPHMARIELEAGAELFYREPAFNTYGFLNVREDFSNEYPEYVDQVIELYEEARNWILENEEEAVELLAEEADISEEVAEIQLERNDFSNPIPGEEHEEAIKESGYILQDGEVIEQDADIDALVEELINPEFAERTIDD
ncbi:sulfonate transport system substrate-binding protein [Pelagirhabdus alkalitolerans]|uniref:Putative aliphatic sulfonates-binding protein n=1 Tax=Pelagirhabdus alkalitolerans TaxID=1612202 RepID=A0A1G6LD37_9BACI|nr:aliphatic sulfonate ABC transporter substrate-binding protein [Pelagirhabdus alkalitolerans]SDC40695.1 sulfonate transport system substrate-binding protein [Pelagirhabdus alkalitolerans]